MRFLISFFLSISLLNSFGQTTGFYEEYNLFLSKYNEDGLVDYKGIKDNQKDLDKLIVWVNDSSWTAQEEKAYLINVYNIMVIKKVVDEYPVSSPMDITNFFDKKDINLKGDMISLNEIENKILLKKYHDPRLHFALVCGALGMS
jgi:hypothetical protein